MTDPTRQLDLTAEHPWAHRLRAAAFILLLACIVGRCYLPEAHTLRPPIDLTRALQAADDLAAGADIMDPIEREPLARVTFAMVLLSAGLIWSIANVINPVPWRGRFWIAALLAFAALSAVSAWRANSPAAAWATWWDQLAILLAGALACQLCDRPTRWRWLIAVVITLGITLTAKGLYQHWVEFPFMRDSIASDPGLLAEVQGIQAGSSTEALFTARAAPSNPVGYFFLSNVLASLLLVPLIMLPALIVAVYRQLADRRLRRLVAIALSLVTGAIAYCLVLTASRGAILAGVGVLAAGIAVLLLPARWRRTHRRKLIATVALAILLIAGALTLRYHQTGVLPGGKSMAVRGQYWAVTPNIMKGHALFGVGGGNYADHYLAHRLPGAEESIKMPHNVAAHALTQFGLLGGGVYLAMLIGTLIALTRHAEPVDEDTPNRRADIAAVVFLTLAVFTSCAIFGDAPMDIQFIVFLAAGPALLFAAVCGLMLLILKPGIANAPLVRVGVIIGLMAMALHNLISVSLWMPGTATLFWVLAGAAVCPVARRWRSPAIMQWLLVTVLAALLATCTIAYAAPAAWRVSDWRYVAKLLAAREYGVAARYTGRMFTRTTYPLDAAQASRLCEYVSLAGLPEQAGAAIEFARRAVMLEPESSGRHTQLASVLWTCGDLTDPAARDEAIAHALTACDLDPQNPNHWLFAATLAVHVNDLDLALGCATRAIACDEALTPESLYHLTADERAWLDDLVATS